MALSCFTLTGVLAITYNAARGLLATAGSASRAIGLKLSDGTATNQADGVYTADTSVSKAGVNIHLDSSFDAEPTFTLVRFRKTYQEAVRGLSWTDNAVALTSHHCG